MSESRAKNKTAAFESPYQRVLLLLVGIVVAVGLIFGINMIARGLGGNEKKLAEAVIASLKEPSINGDFTLAQQAQTNTFDAKGTFSVDKLKRATVDGELNGAFQGDNLKVPVTVYADLDRSTTYVKLDNATQLASTISKNTPTVEADLSSIASKIDGKWLRIVQDKDKANTCTTKLFEKIAQDSDAAGQFAKLYAGNRFLSVESVETKSDSKQEYTVNYDDKAMGGFVKDLKTTDVFKSIKSCESSYDPFGTESTQVAQAQQQQAAEPATTTKITVSDGRVTNFVVVSTFENQVSTTRIGLNYKQHTVGEAPTSDIVEYSALDTEISSLGRMFQQQQQQQQQQQSTLNTQLGQ